MTRCVAITGVSGGIGAATAAAFSASGWVVLGFDKSAPAADIALDSFELVDLAHADIDRMLGMNFSRATRLDALVNAAAIQGTQRLDHTDTEAWDSILAANTRGTFLAMKAAHARLAESNGAVVNIASVHAVATSVNAGPYAASKGAVMALTRAAAIEWGPEVRVNAVLPGAVDTPMLRQGMLRSAAADETDAAIRTLESRTPLGRIGRPNEIAEAILFLADAERSSFITGQALVVDGGALARLSTE